MNSLTLRFYAASLLFCSAIIFYYCVKLSVKPDLRFLAFENATKVQTTEQNNYFTDSSDVQVYEDFFKCCSSQCNAEDTGTKTDKASCNEHVKNAVSPVKCEISKSFRLKNAANESWQLEDCRPHLINYTCEQLSESTLPCNKTFQILQYNYHTQYHCLKRLADAVNSRRTMKVPRIHHQVWLYGDKVQFEFYQYISLIATLRYFRPELIFLWNDGHLPKSKWWQEFIGHVNQVKSNTRTLIYPLEGEALPLGVSRNITNRTVCLYDVTLVSVVRETPQTIYGRSFQFKEHKSDVVRLEAMLLFGGLYTDVDAIPINDLDPLLNVSVSMGEENANALTNMAILGERYSPHFYAYHHNYVDFEASHWSRNSILNNMALARECPDFVNVEKRMIDPVWEQKQVYYSGDQDLSKNFMVHLYWRFLEKRTMQDPLEILKAPFLGARLFRNIYYSCTPLA